MNGKVSLVEYDFMMDNFVPAPDDRPEPSDRALASKFKFNGIVKPESKMNEALPRSITNAWLRDDEGTDFVLFATHNKIDPTDETKQRVDISMYRAEAGPEEYDKDEPTNWAAVELSLECKPEEEADDPFDDNADNFQATSLVRRSNFGQVISYAALVFAKQQRTHHFTVMFLGHKARIIRWDRAGTIVTKKFDYTKEPEKLGRFFWRFVRLSDAQRGHDPTVTEVLSTSEDYKLMMSRADTPILVGDGEVKHEMGKHARLLFKESLKPSVPWYRIRVGGVEDGRHFLVGAPHFIAPELVGRGTRGYVAIDCADPEGPFVFVKDAWRVAHKRIEPEGDILEYLNEQGVPNVPTLVCHGDVDEQETESQKVWRRLHQDSSESPVKTHRHYRIVVKEVGLPMSRFHNAHELVYLLARCISAHEGAYKKGILHRDISAGNVLILVREYVVDGELVQERDGLLTDWELSKRLDEVDLGPRQPDRTGTWQFMSANALTNPYRIIIIPDEMESFFHLLLFYCLRYLPHNCPDVARFMHTYFDGYSESEGKYYCGTTKWNAMTEGSLYVFGMGELEFYTPVEPVHATVPSITQPSTTSANELSEDETKGTEPITSSRPRELHPINDLLTDFLNLLKAHYALNSERKKASGARPVTASSHGVKAPPTPRSDAVSWFTTILISTGNAGATTKPKMSREQRAIYAQLSAQLESHQWLISVFGKYYVHEDQWPAVDRVPDQLRKGFRPNKDKAPARASRPATGSKRASLHDEANREESGSKRQALRRDESDAVVSRDSQPKRRSTRSSRQGPP